MKKNKNQGEGFIPEISRRHFIQAGSALAALPLVVTTRNVQAQDAAATRAAPEEKVVQTCSTFDCGGKCDIRAHVSEGVVTRISTRRIMHWIRRCRLCVPAYVAERIGNLFIIPIGLNIQ